MKVQIYHYKCNFIEYYKYKISINFGVLLFENDFYHLKLFLVF